ncbi:O-antigen ligase family protein [Novipirellula artificiosorum]|uniref:O-Antigen ligase n=1 Tax=Novipirellula artificiosorum TaxID=2528016 RepID=A0A5C6DEL5_9BACT|nr:O-antigen ligase family protein [Novipirellula artificiosorum]TWU33369.1 O-Antigen ligase [Novipirellula artificiosorum]
MILMIALFVLAAILWIVPLLQHGRTPVIGALVLLTGTVFGPAFFSIDGPIQMSLDRLLFVALLGMLAIRWRQGQLQWSRFTRTDWGVAVLLMWLLVSSLISGPAPQGQSPISDWLSCFAMPVGMYVAIRLSDIRASDMLWVQRMLLGLSVYLAITAVFEVTGLHRLVVPRYVVDPTEWEFFGRGRGPLMNPSGNAIVISIGLVIAVLGIIHSTRRMKLVYSLLTITLLAGVYSTLTRSGWLGAIAAMGVIVLVYSPRWVRVLGLASIVVLGGASVAGLKDQFLRMKRDKNLTSADAEKSVQLRPLLAIVAWEMFKDKPIFGHGYGHYFACADSYHNIRTYDMPLNQARPYAQHNVFLSILVDSGLMGLTIFVSILITISSLGWQLARNTSLSIAVRNGGLLWLGGFAAYFCNGMFQDASIIPMANMFLFFLAGIAMTLHQRGLAKTPTLSPPVAIAGTGLPAALSH